MSVARLALLLAVAACGGDRAAPAPPPAPLGIEVGATPVGEARAAIEGRGHACVDASLAAMMQKAHAGKAMPAGMPAGHARYLKDPALAQARISCDGVPLDAIEPGRPAVPARVLVVAPRAGAPVSLVAVQRTHTDAAAAADDARAMFSALERRLGRPDERQGEPPAAGARLARMQIVRRAWTRGDTVIEATAVDLGATGISVSEEIRRRNEP